MENKGEQVQTKEEIIQWDESIEDERVLPIAIKKPRTLTKALGGAVLTLGYVLAHTPFITIKQEVIHIALPLLLAIAYGVSINVFEILYTMYQERLMDRRGRGKYVHIRQKGTQVYIKNRFGEVLEEKMVRGVRLCEMVKKERKKFYEGAKTLVLFYGLGRSEEIPVIERRITRRDIGDR